MRHANGARLDAPFVAFGSNRRGANVNDDGNDYRTDTTPRPSSLLGLIVPFSPGSLPIIRPAISSGACEPHLPRRFSASPFAPRESRDEIKMYIR